MNEQPINQISPEVPKQKGPAIVIGILVVIIIILIAGGFYFLKMRNPGIQTSAPMAEKTMPAETTPATQTSEQSAQPDKTDGSSASSASNSSSQSSVDFNYELKQLDSQANSVSSTDFSDAEMSDAKAGL
jgi:uncharacterized protein HemX